MSPSDKRLLDDSMSQARSMVSLDSHPDPRVELRAQAQELEDGAQMILLLRSRLQELLK